ncbi:MAG: hypothetical protein WCI18_00315 [Pseudomonadota bacterium]
MSKSIDYREMLRLEFNLRRIRNPKYSLRAFARDCKISASRFSEVFNEHNHLSISSGQRIVQYLGLSAQMTQNFLDSIIKESRKSDGRKGAQKVNSSVAPIDNKLKIPTQDEPSGSLN